MSKYYYANNTLRKQLSKIEKKRYNAYKKRECERRRRYKRKGVNHKCFWSYRCEVCKQYYEEERNIGLFYGFSVCFECEKNEQKKENFFKKQCDWNADTGTARIVEDKRNYPVGNKTTTLQLTIESSGTHPNHERIELFEIEKVDEEVVHRELMNLWKAVTFQFSGTWENATWS